MVMSSIQILNAAASIVMFVCFSDYKKILQIRSCRKKAGVYRFQGELQHRPKGPPLITTNIVTLFHICKYRMI